MENMNTKRSVKAHYSNIQRLKFNPQHNRVPENLDDSLELYFPERQSQAPTQTQRAQTQGSQSQPRDPSQRDGADRAHPSQRDGADNPQPTPSTSHQPMDNLRSTNPFADSDEEEEDWPNVGRQTQDDDWELADDYEWPPFPQRRGQTQESQRSTRSSQRPGTPFNRSPAQASPENDDVDFGDMVQENTQFSTEDTGTSQGGQTEQAKEAEDPKPQEEEETVKIFLKTTQNSQIPQVVDIQTIGGQSSKRAKRIEKPKVSIRIVNDEDTEMQDKTDEIEPKQKKTRQVQVRYVQDQDVPKVEDIQNKPRKGRPRKRDSKEKVVPMPKPEEPKVIHKYETRSKKAQPSSNLAQVYTVGEVLYRRLQPDGTYMEVYNIEAQHT
jgi:hypothetical protein